MSRPGLIDRFRARAAAHAAGWQRVALALLVAVCCVQWAHVALRPRGDFHLHWEFGRRLAAGEFLYQGGMNLPYPPFWALAHVPLAELPLPVAQVVLFPLCGLALGVLMWSLNDVLRGHLEAPPLLAFWSAALAIGLASRFLIRDMLECGVNLALVAASWAAVALWMRRRDVSAGVVLGTAVALKCTPALFLAWFVWKRQWRVSSVAAVTAVVLTLSPAIVMGSRAYADALSFWIQSASRGAGLDPSQGVLGEEPLQNISLRAALGRFLMRLPDGHAGRLEHPLYVDVFDLSPAAAGWVVKAVTLLVVCGAAWLFRRRVADRRSLPLAWECAGLSLLILLLSPITWGQHCVGVLPLLYVLARTNLSGQHGPRWVRGTVVAYAILVLALNRALLGRELSWLLDSYHVTTWCLAALLAVAFRCAAMSATSRAACDTVPTDERSCCAVVSYPKGVPQQSRGLAERTPGTERPTHTVYPDGVAQRDTSRLAVQPPSG